MGPDEADSPDSASAAYRWATLRRRFSERLSEGAASASHLARSAEQWITSPTAARNNEVRGPRLSLWFGVVGFICILLTSAATAAVLSNYIERSWIKQDERSLSDFVRSAVIAHNAAPLFQGDAPPATMSRELDMMFRIIAGRDPVFLAHFYSPEGRIFWSSDPVFVGRSFDENDELASALRGRTVTEIGELSELEKPEHSLVDPKRILFVETYIPVFGGGSDPIGVVEIYRTPRHLQRAISDSNWLIWSATLLSGLTLYVTLGWIARWGDRQLERSARDLAESNSFAAVGEVATAVAHGLRNPLAAMRSSAELALDRPNWDGDQTALHEVIRQTDRLDNWVRALLGCLRAEELPMERIPVRSLLEEAQSAAQSRLEKVGMTCEIKAADPELEIHANRTAIFQVLECLIANALEAGSRGGAIVLTGRVSETLDRAIIEVADDGPGPDARSDPFASFITTKGKGLGVGLPIARRLARRHGGSLMLTAGHLRGAVARLDLPLSNQHTQRA